MLQKVPQNLLRNSRELRKNQTPWEYKLWYHLRNKRFLGLKFKRQVRIGKYIVDFCCSEKRIIIELDGGQHGIDLNKSLDEKRDCFLIRQGYRVLHFWNHEFDQNTEEALELLRVLIADNINPSRHPSGDTILFTFDSGLSNNIIRIL